MEEILEILSDVPLFEGISAEELRGMLKCLSARTRKYDRGGVIFMAGDAVTDVGIVLRGNVHVIREDMMGNRAILSEFGAGNLFAESFSCAGAKKIPVTAMAAVESEIMLIDYRRIISNCSSACEFHTRLIGNMLRILANKNILLNEKLQVMARRTTREKLMTYLHDQSRKAASDEFSIPFNRQELADYLGVDRSAMSSELGRLRDEGLIEYEKNRFKIHRRRRA